MPNFKHLHDLVYKCTPSQLKIFLIVIVMILTFTRNNIEYYYIKKKRRRRKKQELSIFIRNILEF